MPNQRSTTPDQHQQALVHTGSLAASPRTTDSAKVRQYALREHGLLQEPHIRSAGAPWREREAGRRDQSIEGAGARSDDIFRTKIISTDIPGHTATGKGNRRDDDQRGHHSHG